MLKTKSHIQNDFLVLTTFIKNIIIISGSGETCLQNTADNLNLPIHQQKDKFQLQRNLSQTYELKEKYIKN